MKTLLKVTLLFSLLMSYSFLVEKEVKLHMLTITVVDSLSKEALMGSTLEVTNVKDSTVVSGISDENGQVSIPLKKGTYSVLAHYVGYGKESVRLGVYADTSIYIYLKEAEVTLSEVKVISEHPRVRFNGIVSHSAPRSIAPAGESPRTKTESKRKKERSESLERTKMPDDSYVGESRARGAGTLTAGEINDFEKWVLWEDLNVTEFKSYKKAWDLKFNERRTVQVSFENGYPISDAVVELYDQAGKKLYIARTDNTGRAELWFEWEGSEVKAKVVYKEEVQWLEVGKSPAHIGTVQFKQICTVPDSVDIAFVVDATGSMGDEINYLKTELEDVIQRAAKANPDILLRTSAVFYRDQFDEYLVRSAPFSGSLDPTLAFIREQRAHGGGDFPEAVEAGLEEAISRLRWSKEARARILFLLLDAPPHQVDSVYRSLNRLVRLAAEKGIRIIPVTGSGIDKSTEFLMRSLALMTNGTYTFLTDDSGIGGSHIKPSTDSYEVEKLNDLMLRLIQRYVHSDNCQLPKISSDAKKDSIAQAKNKKAEFKLYPVPSAGPVKVEVEKAGGILSLLDMNGRILFRADMKERKKLENDFSQLTSGVYVFRYELGDAVLTKKWVLRH